MPEDNKRFVTKAAAVVGAATLCSRILGFIRDIAIAWYFGAGLASDAFFVAFRIPNLFRRLFAEGSLSISFIPVFAGCLAREGKNEANRLAGAAAGLISLILVAVVISGILLSPYIVKIMAPGFKDTAGKFSLTVSLTRTMLPYLFFICLAALFMGILNVLGHFAAPAFAPALLNISMITSLLFIPAGFGEPVKILAAGVLAGGFLQLLIQIPFLVKNGINISKNAALYHPGIKDVGILMLPAIFGAAVYQINILIGTLLASFLSEGSVSYLYYADRLVQLPLGIFAISAATAVFPALSRQASENEMEAFRDTFDYSVRMVMFITFPCMIGLIVLGEPIIMLLFKRGEFDVQSATLTAQALLYYSTGLWAFALVRIVVSMFYALRDTSTPVITASISLFANVVLSLLLMKPLKHGGLALATSLSSMLNVVLLLRALSIKMGFPVLNRVKESFLKIAVSSLIMGCVVCGMAGLLMPSYDESFWKLISGVICCILGGIISYSIASLLVGSPEIKSIIVPAGKDINKIVKKA
jgi:putative peptidoglycan lipid II flippase